MIRKQLHTPEGVRDIYSSECAGKQALEQKIGEVVHKFGYQDIETPTFEYFDVFSGEIGTIQSSSLYKFFDREGNTLVLRPDFTPSIARAVSRYFNTGEEAVRLCYKGNTFINNSSYQGRLKETTQMGTELIGDGSVDADVETILLVIEALKASGLTDFQVTIGHVGFYEALVEKARISEQNEAELKQLIVEKNTFGVGEFLSTLSMAEEEKEVLGELTRMFGSVELLQKLLVKTAKNEKAVAVLNRLVEMYEILDDYGYGNYINFDLGLLGRYMYYTGIVFRAYTFGTGVAVVKGGRYDHLLEKFGTPAPSVGFVIVVDELQNALKRQKIKIQTQQEIITLVYSPATRKAALKMAKILRGEGKYIRTLCLADPDAVAAYNKATGEVIKL